MSSIPEHLLDHLKEREGYREDVYRDSVGKLTCGVGHLLTEIEADLWPLGSRVPVSLINDWLEQDTEKAWLAAENQAKGLDYPKLQEALFPLCYQLGAGWNLIHRKTWALLKAHEWLEAANEAEDSLWFRQTPLRVRDFQIALWRATG